MRVQAGGSLSVYSAVFAPIQLKTNVVHKWRHYDETARTWRTKSTVRFPIVGGREGGYRGYSIKSSRRSGRWRVDIETPDGLLIGRVPFSVRPGSAAGRTLQVHVVMVTPRRRRLEPMSSPNSATARDCPGD